MTEIFLVIGWLGMSGIIAAGLIDVYPQLLELECKWRASRTLEKK
jgi:hypothetical protein